MIEFNRFKNRGIRRELINKFHEIGIKISPFWIPIGLVNRVKNIGKVNYDIDVKLESNHNYVEIGYVFPNPEHAKWQEIHDEHTKLCDETSEDSIRRVQENIGHYNPHLHEVPEPDKTLLAYASIQPRS